MPQSRSEVDFCSPGPLTLMSSEHLHRVKLVDGFSADWDERSGPKGLTEGSGSFYNFDRICARNE